jgi:DNA-binding Lrp family transcriptional regulator
MKLSVEERDVIASLTLRGEVSVREVAQCLSIKEHRVRYILDKIISNGLCYFYPIINPHRLGYLECNLFIELQSGGTSARQKLLEALRQNRATKTIGVLGGEYQFDVVVWLKGIHELATFFNAVSDKCPDVHYRIDFVLLGKAFYFPANFIVPRNRATTMVWYGPSGDPPLSLDAIDKEILEGLTRAPYTGARNLAKTRQIPESTVTYRLNKLKADGVIVCMGYMVDHLKVGLTLTTLLLKAKRPSQHLTQQLLEIAGRDGSFGFLVECYGAWDYQLGVLLYDQTKLSGVIDRLQENLGAQLDRVRSLPSFETVSVQVAG